MNSPLRLTFLVPLLACLLSRASVADTGLIMGNVTDAEGKSIASATVMSFRSGETKHTATAVTDKSGKFRADDLPPVSTRCMQIPFRT